MIHPTNVPLFKAMEIRLARCGRCERTGQVWCDSLDRVRAAGEQMLLSPATLRVEIVSDNGVTIEVLRRM